jgi:hypothetical protein
MKTKLILATLLITLSSSSFCQQDQTWEKWVFLMGEWKGEGSGQPGQGGGVFSFQYDLNKNILVRKSHSEYPGQDGKKAIHDDLMIVYPENNGDSFKAIYFDNEKHVINYNIAFAVKSVILTSQKSAGTPIFRLTYNLLDSNTVNTKFEMSQDGEKFMPYIEGKSIRTK